MHTSQGTVLEQVMEQGCFHMENPYENSLAPSPVPVFGNYEMSIGSRMLTLEIRIFMSGDGQVMTDGGRGGEGTG